MSQKARYLDNSATPAQLPAVSASASTRDSFKPSVLGHHASNQGTGTRAPWDQNETLQFAKRSSPRTALPTVGNFASTTTAGIPQTPRRSNNSDNRTSQLNHKTGSRRFIPPSRMSSDSITNKSHASTSSDATRNIPRFTSQKQAPMGPPPLPTHSRFRPGTSR
jgi:hypothetical protein